MFIKHSRRDAQSSVLTITDGKPSFAYSTNEMVEQLDDKGIMRYFVVVSAQGARSDAMKQMRKWASQPSYTNLLQIPGADILEADVSMWAQKALVKFCPQAYVPQPPVSVLRYIHVK